MAACGQVYGSSSKSEPGLDGPICGTAVNVVNPKTEQLLPLTMPRAHAGSLIVVQGGGTVQKDAFMTKIKGFKKISLRDLGPHL